jgi:hypothetical protein
VDQKKKKQAISRWIVLLGMMISGMAIGLYAARYEQHSKLSDEEAQETTMKAFHRGTEWGYLRASIDFRAEKFSIVLPPEEVERAVAYANRWDRKCVVQEHETDPNLMVVVFEPR